MTSTKGPLSATSIADLAAQLLGAHVDVPEGDTAADWAAAIGAALVGESVEGGEPGTETYDTGSVVATRETSDDVPEWVTAEHVEVAWDGAVARTWTPIADLRPL